MIGIDTNILVRFFAQDDPVQCQQADEIMASLSETNQAWISIAALLKFVWVMTRSYRVDRSAMARMLDGLLSQNLLVIEQPETAQEALQVYQRSRADFADCLIAASARAAGCQRVFTFDRIAARDAGMELAE